MPVSEAQKAANKRYNEKNKEKMRLAKLAANKRYYEKNKEALQAYGRRMARDYYYNNPNYQQKKSLTSKEKVYVEGTIKFIRRLFE